MKIVVAIDSFKGSLTSRQAGEAVAQGILRAMPDATVEVCPVADGGEGTAAVLTAATNSRVRTVNVRGPLSETVKASYGISPDGTTAFMEMAQAAGLPLISPERRNPMHTTTYGVGEMIADALRLGCRKIVMGIGGSATNDGGIGMLQALGFGMLDEYGEAVPPGAKGLERLRRITTDGVIDGLSDCRFAVACDVVNPLCGANGCSAVYAPQKGADRAAVEAMDEWMAAYAALVKTVLPRADDTAAGAGAAGGLGFALAAFLGADMTNGIALVMEESGLSEKLRSADLVITGEGRLDGQSAMGKTPCGIAAHAKRYHKPVIAFAGGVTSEATRCHDIGIDAYFPAVRGVCTLDEAMEPQTAHNNLASAAEEAMRLFQAAREHA